MPPYLSEGGTCTSSGRIEGFDEPGEKFQKFSVLLYVLYTFTIMGFSRVFAWV
jgi:hypothetical protein